MKISYSIGAVLGAFLLAGGVWYLAIGRAPSDTAISDAFVPSIETPTTAASATAASAATIATVSTPVQIPDGYHAYSNAAFHLSLAYPPDLKVQEYQETGGAETVTFTDAAGEKSFQMFIEPYGGTTITKERFKLDEPSGVLNEPTQVVIAGVPATMFFSSNFTMGDTREVWFIKGGFLYEVTTYKELDTWLAVIMATWKFI